MRLAIIFLSVLACGFTSSLAAEETLDIRIPVLDMKDYYDEAKRDPFLDTLYDAMRSVGFFAVPIAAWTQK